MIANGHAKAVGAEMMRGMGSNVPLSAKLEAIEKTARDMTTAGLQRLGPAYRIDVKDDPRRGRIIDVVRDEATALEGSPNLVPAIDPPQSS